MSASEDWMIETLSAIAVSDTYIYVRNIADNSDGIK